MMQFDKFFHNFFLSMSLLENATTPWGQSWERVPGHLELTANKMGQIWNNMNLSNAKSIPCTRACYINGIRRIQKFQFDSL